MQNKTTNRWLDVQIVILTITMTLSLFLWNLFASGNRQTVSGTVVDTLGISVAGINASQPKVRILLGGAAPKSPGQISASAPAPVTVTGSSR
jgi:hypothetical protein